MKKLTQKKIIIWLLMVVLGYHAIFGTARVLIDFKYPMGSNDNTIAAFGTHLRTGILYEYKPRNTHKWFLSDIQPELQSDTRSDFIATPLEDNVYDYEIQMGWFYQYKVLYVLGRNGFWIINADPFHITLLRNKNISPKSSKDLDEALENYEKYENQFTQTYSAAELTPEEQKAYIKLQEKAQPRIQELKELGLYP